MQQFTNPQDMQRWAEAQRAAGQRIAFVPTMGALHEGHMHLVAQARERAERVVVSVFVNPIQFNRRDDFELYPRPIDADAALCRDAGVDAFYVPTPGAMYPEGFQTHVEPGSLADPLCGAGRPGHFRGVTTVVSKLFNAVRPHVALFGEKDFQQLAIIRRMTVDLDFGIEIVGVPTVREADGLALSSRNRRLSVDDRRAALCVPSALAAADAVVHGGERRATAVAERASAVINAEPRARLEYAELRDPDSLCEVDVVEGPTLLALAVWVGDVRLIDNRVLMPEGSCR